MGMGMDMRKGRKANRTLEIFLEKAGRLKSSLRKQGMNSGSKAKLP